MVPVLSFSCVRLELTLRHAWTVVVLTISPSSDWA